MALMLAVSLPAVLPSSAEDWVMSRTSSTIWKARPAFSPKVRRRVMVSSLSITGCAVEAAGDDAGGDEGSGFGAVDGFDQFGGGGGAFGLDVDYLAADHAGREWGSGGLLRCLRRGRCLLGSRLSSRGWWGVGRWFGRRGFGGRRRRGWRWLRRRLRGRWAGRGGGRRCRGRVGRRG